jgi:MFS family permease
VPVYLSEISDPKHRGFIGGLSGVNLSCGIMVANWIGFACNYAPYGELQWRLPLALQIPWGIIMFIGLITFMPNSPRSLLQKGKVEEARKAFVRVRRDLQSHEVQQEFALMMSQIAFEHEQRSPSFASAFVRYRRRVLVSISVQVLTAVTGVNVIQYY